MALGGMLRECRCGDNPPSERHAILYCLGLASAFVLSMYALIPPRVRRMDRNNEIHIQWRAVATGAVTIGAVLSYPLLICDKTTPDPTEFSADKSWSMLDILWPRHVEVVLLHVCILYAGAAFTALLRVYRHRQRSVNQNGRPSKNSFPSDIVRLLLKPSITSLLNPLSETERWMNSRNYVIAPLTEEIVFRGCMVPALLAAGFSVTRTCLIAPLFFGVAHAHHAMVQLMKGHRVLSVCLTTFFQFAYTSLFGSYASYAFIRTGSVTAVAVAHAYCNWMGLPNLSFVDDGHMLHEYRTYLVLIYIAGVLAFKWFLSSDILLPWPSVLPEMLSPPPPTLVEDEGLVDNMLPTYVQETADQYLPSYFQK